jgi:hypothetical protein
MTAALIGAVVAVEAVRPFLFAALMIAILVMLAGVATWPLRRRRH